MAKTALSKVHSASYAQMLALLTQIAGNIAYEKGNVTSAYKALIGDLGKTSGDTPVDHTVVTYIAQEIAKVTSAATTLEGRVKANEDALTLLNNNAETVGSVDYKVAQGINDFATKISEDGTFNTFKEMVDYIAAHGTEYTNLAALVGTLPEGCQQTTVVAYAKALADAAESAAKTYADGLASNYDAAGAAAAVQGDTENTVKDLEDAINGFDNFSETEMNTLKALFPTSAE